LYGSCKNLAKWRRRRRERNGSPGGWRRSKGKVIVERGVAGGGFSFGEDYGWV